MTGFNFGEASANSPTRKSALDSWTNYYRSLLIKPGQIVQQLYPTIGQCETLDADTLKREKPQLIRQLNSLKSQFKTHFNTLIEVLSDTPQDVLVRGILGDLTSQQKRTVNSYYADLQAEITTNLTLSCKNFSFNCTTGYARTIGYILLDVKLTSVFLQAINSINLN